MDPIDIKLALREVEYPLFLNHREAIVVQESLAKCGLGDAEIDDIIAKVLLLLKRIRKEEKRALRDENGREGRHSLDK